MQIPAEHEANVFGQLDAYAKKIERTVHVTLIERRDSGKAAGAVPAGKCDHRTKCRLSHFIGYGR